MFRKMDIKYKLSKLYWWWSNGSERWIWIYQLSKLYEHEDDDINDNLKDQDDEHEDDDDGINDDLKDQDNKNEDDDDDEGVPCECVLLNPLPLCVLSKLSFSVRHGFVNHLYYLLTLEKYYHYYCNHSLNFLLILHFISQMLLFISLNW